MGKILRNKTFQFTTFVFLSVMVVYWTWLIPGPRVANDLPYVSLESLQEQFDIPRAWQSRGDGMGEYATFTLWSWPSTVISGLLAKFGAGFALQERLIFIFPIVIIGTLSIYKILTDLKLSKASVFVATFYYLTNTYLILLIDGGQLSVALTFAYFPMAFRFLANALTDGLRKKIVAGVAVSLLGFLDIRFVYILMLLFMFYIFCELVWQKKRVYLAKETFEVGIVVAIIFFTLHFYWILPLVKYPLSSEVYGVLTESSGLNFTTLKHSLLVLQPHWYLNVFGKVSQIRHEFLLIPVLAFTAPFLSYWARRKEMFGKAVFWTLVAILSVFLAKGGSPPLSGLYPWIYSNVPGFSLFRDSTKFFFLITLSYSILIALTVDFLIKKFSRLKLTIPLSFVIYFFFLANPVWLDKMTGMFSPPMKEIDFAKAAEIIKDDISFGRVLWIGAKAPLGYSSPTHPSVETSRLQGIRPFAIGTVGTYETLNFLREAKYMGELLDVANISYIVHPFPDTTREELKGEDVAYYYAFWDQLGGKEWVEKKLSEPPVALLKTKSSHDKFFVAKNTWLVVGSDRVYDEFALDGNVLADNALIFAQENLDFNDYVDMPNLKVLQYGDEPLFLFDKYVFLSDMVARDPTTTLNWWKREDNEIVWVRDFFEQKYGLFYQEFTYQKGLVITEKFGEILIKDNGFIDGRTLYARVLFSPRGGIIKFFQGDRQLGEVDTKTEDSKIVTRKLSGHGDIPDSLYEYAMAEFSTRPVGQVDGSRNDIRIVAEGDINAINFIAQGGNPDGAGLDNAFSWNNIGDREKKELFAEKAEYSVEYVRMSSTKYKVNVSGVSSPVTLVFSERFDENWKLDGRSAFPVYSFLNGFTVYQDGEYEVYFEPQRYVYPGLAVSGLTLAAIAGYFLYTFINARKSS